MPPSPRILIVDNDAIITHLVSTMLQKKGYTIAGMVNTGGEALIKTAELGPDLVIMDANLPGSWTGWTRPITFSSSSTSRSSLSPE